VREPATVEIGPWWREDGAAKSRWSKTAAVAVEVDSGGYGLRKIRVFVLGDEDDDVAAFHWTTC